MVVAIGVFLSWCLIFVVTTILCGQRQCVLSNGIVTNFELIKFAVTILSGIIVILIYFGNIAHRNRIEKLNLKNKKIEDLLGYVDDLEEAVSSLSREIHGTAPTGQLQSLIATVNILGEKVFKFVECSTDFDWDDDTKKIFVRLNSICSDNDLKYINARLLKGSDFQLLILAARELCWKSKIYA